MSAAVNQLTAIDTAVQALRQPAGGVGRIAALSATARDSAALLDALPARYREVLLNLLDRLEAGALFSEESCSFSQTDLLDHLQVWVDKARGQL